MTGTAWGYNFDANTLRPGLNSGGSGRVSLAAEGYGPIALYIGGTGEVEFKDMAISNLGLRVRQPNYTSPDFRKQTLSNFYFGWGQAAGDFNHDGHLDIAVCTPSINVRRVRGLEGQTTLLCRHIELQ